MSSIGTDSLTSKHESEFARLKRSSSRKLLRGVLFLIITGAALALAVGSIIGSRSYDDTISPYRRDLISNGSGWGADLIDTQRRYADWIDRYSTAGDVGSFNYLSSYIFSGASAIARYTKGSESLGTFGGIAIALLHGLLRVVFIVVACWRVWLLFVAIAFYRGWSALQVYTGPDLLGETGNGRLFYSGIRIGLDNLTASGAPDKQVVGLACPKQASPSHVQNSGLGKLLSHYNVANQTNLALAGVILAHATWPPYIAPTDEESLMAQCWKGTTLEDNTVQILERILDLHLHYQHGATDKDFDEYLSVDDEIDEPLDATGYSVHLQRAAHRVLTPSLRQQMGAIPHELVATAVLAYEAGKSMSNAYDGGKWIRRSNFPQLSARAVLHAMPRFGKEYDFDQRSTIRRALVYGSRYSSLGPVTAPIDLSLSSRALRQWIELFMASPHELDRVSREVEMHGIIGEVHTKWQQIIIDGVMTGHEQVLKGAYATSGNLFLLPVSNVIKLARRSITLPMLRRLEQLISIVNQEQALEMATSEVESDSQERPSVPVHIRVFKPFSDQELEALTRNYGIRSDEARDWSSLRVVLNSFGWLGRRVGDYSVPESSIIYAIFRVAEGHPDANAYGLIGVPGMVPLRATRLEGRWGKGWQQYFPSVLSATMAENVEDYNKLMSGARDLIEEELPIPHATNVA